MIQRTTSKPHRRTGSLAAFDCGALQQVRSGSHQWSDRMRPLLPCFVVIEVAADAKLNEESAYDHEPVLRRRNAGRTSVAKRNKRGNLSGSKVIQALDFLMPGNEAARITIKPAGCPNLHVQLINVIARHRETVGQRCCGKGRAIHCFTISLPRIPVGKKQGNGCRPHRPQSGNNIPRVLLRAEAPSRGYSDAPNEPTD